jgi:hypothetical protein
MSRGELTTTMHFIVYPSDFWRFNIIGFICWIVMQRDLSHCKPCWEQIFRLIISTKTLRGRRQCKYIKILCNIFLLVINSCFLVISNRTHSRHRFVAAASRLGTNENTDVHYPEPSSEANCAANGNCTVKPDYTSRCLSTMTELKSVFNVLPFKLIIIISGFNQITESILCFLVWYIRVWYIS